MGLAHHEREQEIFHTCLALTPSERVAFLQRTCLGDAELQCRVERLLVAHERAERDSLDVLGDLPLDDLPDIAAGPRPKLARPRAGPARTRRFSTTPPRRLSGQL